MRAQIKVLAEVAGEKFTPTCGTLMAFKKGIQGFIDNFGKFLSREEAWELAERQQQIRPHKSIIAGTLYSEDLY